MFYYFKLYFCIQFVGFSSKPLHIYDGIRLFVSGGICCGIVINLAGSFLGLIVFKNLFGGNIGCYTKSYGYWANAELWVSNLCHGSISFGAVSVSFLALQVLKNDEVELVPKINGLEDWV